MESVLILRGATMQKPNILVIGSTNTDLVIRSKRLPTSGETVTGGEFYIAAGGKGANQAVAAARAGADVSFIGCVGDDDFGKQTFSNLKKEGIDTNLIKIEQGSASGVAFILVDYNGSNLISVAPGANFKLFPEDIKNKQAEIKKSAFLLLQLEIPLNTVKTSIEMASEMGTQILLNPAPAQSIAENILAKVDYLTPNEHELSILVNRPIKSANDQIEAAKHLVKVGVKHIFITKGEQGVVLINQDGMKSYPAKKTTAVDTVGAGDCFSGCLASALSEGKDLNEAVNFAQSAAAIAVTRKGAQPSLPYRDEILKML